MLTGHLSPGTQMLPISIPLHAELQLKLCVGDGFPTKSNALCPGVKAFFLFGVLALQLLSHEGGLWPQTAERERGEKEKRWTLIFLKGFE